MSPLMVGTASAATVTKTIKSSCRTNGAPLNLDTTREKTDSIEVTAPDQVKVGEEFEVRVVYKPEKIPGKESVAKIASGDDVHMRLTIDDPSSFVTASLEGSGTKLSGTPKLSLVGGKTLVMSGFNVAVNGEDANWSVPTIVMKMKASKAGKIGTVHPVAEGPGGQFNNPENFVTMKNIVDTTVAGKFTIGLQCQALSGQGTLLSVNAVGGSGDAAAPADDNKADETKADETKADETATESASASASTDASGMEVLEEDPAADEAAATEDEGGLGGGAIAGIVIAVLVVAGGIGYGVYRARKKKGEA